MCRRVLFQHLSVHAVELGFGIQSAGVCLGEAGGGVIVLVGEMQGPSPSPPWQSGQLRKQLFAPLDEDRTGLGSGPSGTLRVPCQAARLSLCHPLPVAESLPRALP